MIHFVLVGRTNSGKSTLFNLLLGEEVAKRNSADISTHSLRVVHASLPIFNNPARWVEAWLAEPRAKLDSASNQSPLQCFGNRRQACYPPP